MHSAELFPHIVDAYLMEAYHVLQYWKFVIRIVGSEYRLPDFEGLKLDRICFLIVQKMNERKSKIPEDNRPKSNYC